MDKNYKEQIEELKSKGYKVKTWHYRNYKPVTINCFECSPREREFKFPLDPKGGSCEVEIITPDGASFYGISHCSKQDCYSRSIGRELAFNRAFEQIPQEPQAKYEMTIERSTDPGGRGIIASITSERALEWFKSFAKYDGCFFTYNSEKPPCSKFLKVMPNYDFEEVFNYMKSKEFVKEIY